MTFRIDLSENRLEVWPLESSDKEALYRLASDLKGWGFRPDFHGPRPATEQEIAGVAAWTQIEDFARKKGVIWYEWPLVLQRSNEDAGGAAFDDVRAQLAERGSEISATDLSEALKCARDRNMPPGRTGRSYTC